MSQLSAPFDYLLNLTGRDMQLERMGQHAAISVKAAMSNFFRNFQLPEEIVVDGRELVLSYTPLKGSDYDPPKRGDRLSDSYLGEMTIREVKELFGLKGEILGFRVRVD